MAQEFEGSTNYQVLEECQELYSAIDHICDFLHHYTYGMYILLIAY